MGTYSGSGSLFALGVRLTKLDTDGSPLVGADNCYQSDSLVQIGLGLEYEEGEEIVQKNGAGITCVYYKAPDTLKRGLIEEFRVCTPDPNILAFCWGGEVINSGGTDEVQSIAISGTPTGGTFTLTFDGQTTGPIDYNATTAEVKTALAALSNLSTDDLTTGGGPLPGTAVTVTFGGDYASTNVVEMTGDAGNLTGGTTPAVTVTTTTQGGGGSAIGYRAPEVNVDPVPNGVGVECWTRAILDNAYHPTLPYFHWVLGKSKLKPAETMVLGGENAATPQMEGHCEQNSSFGDGPIGDISFATDRVWQFAQVASNPTADSTGFVTVVADS